MLCSQKGDRFEMECFYDTVLSSVGSENVTSGLGSENEMSVKVVKRGIGATQRFQRAVGHSVYPRWEIRGSVICVRPNMPIL